MLRIHCQRAVDKASGNTWDKGSEVKGFAPEHYLEAEKGIVGAGGRISEPEGLEEKAGNIMKSRWKH